MDASIQPADRNLQPQGHQEFRLLMASPNPHDWYRAARLPRGDDGSHAERARLVAARVAEISEKPQKRPQDVRLLGDCFSWFRDYLEPTPGLQPAARQVLGLYLRQRVFSVALNLAEKFGLNAPEDRELFREHLEDAAKRCLGRICDARRHYPDYRQQCDELRNCSWWLDEMVRCAQKLDLTSIFDTPQLRPLIRQALSICYRDERAEDYITPASHRFFSSYIEEIGKSLMQGRIRNLWATAPGPGSVEEEERWAPPLSLYSEGRYDEVFRDHTRRLRQRFGIGDECLARMVSESFIPQMFHRPYEILAWATRYLPEVQAGAHIPAVTARLQRVLSKGLSTDRWYQILDRCKIFDLAPHDLSLGIAVPAAGRLRSGKPDLFLFALGEFPTRRPELISDDSIVSAARACLKQCLKSTEPERRHSGLLMVVKAPEVFSPGSLDSDEWRQLATGALPELRQMGENTAAYTLKSACNIGALPSLGRMLQRISRPNKRKG